MAKNENQFWMLSVGEVLRWRCQLFHSLGAAIANVQYTLCMNLFISAARSIWLMISWEYVKLKDQQSQTTLLYLMI